MASRSGDEFGRTSVGLDHTEVCLIMGKINTKIVRKRDRWDACGALGILCHRSLH
jgi:hypothetical protein